MMCFYVRLGLSVGDVWEGAAALGGRGVSHVEDEGQGERGGRAVYTNWRQGTWLTATSYHRKGRLLWEERQDLMEVKQS